MTDAKNEGKALFAALVAPRLLQRTDTARVTAARAQTRKITSRARP